MGFEYSNPGYEFLEDSTINIVPTNNSTYMGFSISPALPPGVEINQNTGVISGKAIDPLYNTKFTITALTTDQTDISSVDIYIAIIHADVTTVDVTVCAENFYKNLVVPGTKLLSYIHASISEQYTGTNKGVSVCISGNNRYAYVGLPHISKVLLFENSNSWSLVDILQPFIAETDVGYPGPMAPPSNSLFGWAVCCNHEGTVAYISAPYLNGSIAGAIWKFNYSVPETPSWSTVTIKDPAIADATVSYPGTYLDCDATGNVLAYSQNLGTDCSFYNGSTETYITVSGTAMKIPNNAYGNIAESKLFVSDYTTTNNTGIITVYTTAGNKITDFATGSSVHAYSGYSFDVNNDGSRVVVAERDSISVWGSNINGTAYSKIGNSFNTVITRGTTLESSSAYSKIITAGTILNNSPLNTVSISADGNKVFVNIYDTDDNGAQSKGLSLWQYDAHKDDWLIVHEYFTPYDTTGQPFSSKKSYASIAISNDGSLLMSAYPNYSESDYTQVSMYKAHTEVLFPNQCVVDSQGAVLSIPNVESVPEGTYVKTVTQVDWVDYKLKLNSEIPNIVTIGKLSLLQGKKHYFLPKQYLVNKGGYIDKYLVNNATPLPMGMHLDQVTGILSGAPHSSLDLSLDITTEIIVSNFTGSDTIDLVFDLTLGPPKLITIKTPVTIYEEQSINIPLSEYGITNKGGKIVSYTSRNLPRGLTIEETTGNIAGTPAFESAGTHHVKILGENNYGYTEGLLEFAVHKSAPAITATGNVLMKYRVKDEVGLTGYTTNSGGTPNTTTLVSGSLNQLSLNLNPKTGVIYGAPDNGADQIFEEEIGLEFTNTYKLLQYPNRIMGTSTDAVSSISFNGKSFAINADGTYAALTYEDKVFTDLGYISNLPHGTGVEDGNIGTRMTTSGTDAYMGDKDINVRHLLGTGSASNTWTTNMGTNISSNYNNGAYSPSRNKFYTGIYSSDLSPEYAIIEVDPINPTNSKIIAHATNNIYGLTIDHQDRYLYYCDNQVIRRIDLQNPHTLTQPGSIVAGSPNGAAGNNPSSINTPVTSLDARFNNPRGLALTKDDAFLYVVEYNNSSICEIDLVNLTVRKFFINVDGTTRYPWAMCLKTNTNGFHELFYNDNWGHGGLGYIYRSTIVSTGAEFKLDNPDPTPVNSDPTFGKRIVGQGTYSTVGNDSVSGGRSDYIQYTMGMVISPDNTTLYFCDTYSNILGQNRIRQVDLTDPLYKVTSLTSGWNSQTSGYQTSTTVDGTGYDSYIFSPSGIAITPDGRKLYVKGYSDVYELDLDPSSTRDNVLVTEINGENIGFYNYSDTSDWVKEGNLPGQPKLMEMTSSGNTLATYESGEVKTFIKSSGLWKTSGNVSTDSPVLAISLNDAGDILAIGTGGNVHAYQRSDTSWEKYGKPLHYESNFGQSLKLSTDGKRLGVTANKFQLGDVSTNIATIFEIGEQAYVPINVELPTWGSGEEWGNVYNFIGPLRDSAYEPSDKYHSKPSNAVDYSYISYITSNWFDSASNLSFAQFATAVHYGIAPTPFTDVAESINPYIVIKVRGESQGNVISGIQISSDVKYHSKDVSKLQQFEVYSSNTLSELTGDIGTISPDLKIHESTSISENDTGLIVFNIKSTSHNFYRFQATKVSSPNKCEFFDEIKLYQSTPTTKDNYMWNPISNGITSDEVAITNVSIDMNSPGTSIVLGLPDSNKVYNYSLSESRPYTWNSTGNIDGSNQFGQAVSINTTLDKLAVTSLNGNTTIYNKSNIWEQWGETLTVATGMAPMKAKLTKDGKRFISGSSEKAHIYEVAKTKPFPIDGEQQNDTIISLPRTQNLSGLTIVNKVQKQSTPFGVYVDVGLSKPNFTGLQSLIYATNTDIELDLQTHNIHGNATAYQFTGLPGGLSVSNMGVMTGTAGSTGISNISMYAENSAGNVIHAFKIEVVAPPKLVSKTVDIVKKYYNKIPFDTYATNEGGGIENLEISKISTKLLGGVVDMYDNITYQIGSSVVTYDNVAVNGNVATKIINYTGDVLEDNVIFGESPFAPTIPTDIYVSGDNDKLAATYIDSNKNGNVVFYDRNGVDQKYYKMDFSNFNEIANVTNISFSTDLRTIKIDHENSANVCRLELVNNEYVLGANKSIHLTKDVKLLENGKQLIDYGITQIPPLYEFTTHTFTNCDATGQEGPTLDQCLTSYGASGWWQNRGYFNMSTRGIQQWTVPADGTYSIEVYGASSGTDNESSWGNPGLGAKIRGDVILAKGQVLYILIGQRGEHSTTGTFGGGGTANLDAGPLLNQGYAGGGGNFVSTVNFSPSVLGVIQESDKDNILFIAGGGGGPAGGHGYGDSFDEAGGHGGVVKGTDGEHRAGVGPGEPGYGGYGGTQTSGGGAGSHAAADPGNSGTLGLGGSVSPAYGDAIQGGGGGGGYYGGGSGGVAGGGGGGGSSYTNTSLIKNSEGWDGNNMGHGKVIIKLLVTTTIPSDVRLWNYSETDYWTNTAALKSSDIFQNFPSMTLDRLKAAEFTYSRDGHLVIENDTGSGNVLMHQECPSTVVPGWVTETLDTKELVNSTSTINIGVDYLHIVSDKKLHAYELAVKKTVPIRVHSDFSLVGRLKKVENVDLVASNRAGKHRVNITLNSITMDEPKPPSTPNHIVTGTGAMIQFDYSNFGHIIYYMLVLLSDPLPTNYYIKNRNLYQGNVTASGRIYPGADTSLLKFKDLAGSGTKYKVGLVVENPDYNVLSDVNEVEFTVETAPGVVEIEQEIETQVVITHDTTDESLSQIVDAIETNNAEISGTTEEKNTKRAKNRKRFKNAFRTVFTKKRVAKEAKAAADGNTSVDTKLNAAQYTRERMRKFNDKIDKIPGIKNKIRIIEPRKTTTNQTMGEVNFRKRSMYIPQGVDDEESVMTDKTSAKTFGISSFMSNSGKEKYNITIPTSGKSVLSAIPKIGTGRRSTVTFAEKHDYSVGDYLIISEIADANYDKQRLRVVDITHDDLNNKQLLVDNYHIIETPFQCKKLLPGLADNYDEDAQTFTHAYVESGKTYLNSFNWSSVTVTGSDTGINHVIGNVFLDYNPIYGIPDTTVTYPYTIVGIKDNKPLPTGLILDGNLLKKDTSVEMEATNGIYTFIGQIDEISGNVEFPIQLNIWDNLTKNMLPSGNVVKQVINKGLRLEYMPQVVTALGEVALQKSILVTMDSNRHLDEMYYSLSAIGGDIANASDKKYVKTERMLIDAWLLANVATLNEFGDIIATVYTGGSPLFDELNNEVLELYDYIRSVHPSKPWVTDSIMENSMIGVWLRNQLAIGAIDSSTMGNVISYKQTNLEKPWFEKTTSTKIQYHIPLDSTPGQSITDCVSVYAKDIYGSEYTTADNCIIYAYDDTSPTGNIKQVTLQANSTVSGIAPKTGKQYNIELGMSEVGNVGVTIRDLDDKNDLPDLQQFKELEMVSGNVDTFALSIPIDTIYNRKLEITTTYVDRASSSNNVIMPNNLSQLTRRITTYPKPIQYANFAIDGNVKNNTGTISDSIDSHVSIADPYILNIEQYQDINFSIAEQTEGNTANISYSAKDWSDPTVTDWAGNVVDKFNGTLVFDSNVGNLSGWFDNVGEYKPSFSVKNAYDKEMVSRFTINVLPAKPILEKYEKGISSSYIPISIDANDATRYSNCSLDVNCGVDNATNSDITGDSLWAGPENGDNMWGIFNITGTTKPISALRLITKSDSTSGNITGFNIYASDNMSELKDTILSDDFLVHRKVGMTSADTGIELINDKITDKKYYKLQVTSSDKVAPQKVISFQLFNTSGGTLDRVRMNSATELVPTIQKLDTNSRTRRSGLAKYTSQQLPTGLYINENTGVISGTPTKWVPEQEYKIFSENSSGNVSRAVTMNFTHFGTGVDHLFLPDGNILDSNLGKALGNLMSMEPIISEVNEKRLRLRNFSREVFGISANVTNHEFILANSNSEFSKYLGNLNNMRSKFRIIRPTLKSDPKPINIPVVNYLQGAERESAYIPFTKEEYGYIRDEIDNIEYRFGKKSDDTFTLERGNVSDTGFTQIDLGETNKEGNTFFHKFTGNDGVNYGRNFTWGSVTTSGFSAPSAPTNFQLTYSTNESVTPWGIENGNVAVTWDSEENFNNGDAITKYDLYRLNTETLDIVSWEINSLVVSFHDTGLVNGQNYEYTLTPFNSVGEGLSAVKGVGIPDIIPPIKPEVMDITSAPPIPLNRLPNPIKFKGESNCIPTVIMNGVEYNSGNITVNQLSIDGDSGNAIYSIISRDGLPPVEAESISDGIYTYQLKLTDQHTNVGELSDGFSFRYDATLPEPPILDSYQVTEMNTLPGWFKYKGGVDCQIHFYVGGDEYSNSEFTSTIEPITDLSGVTIDDGNVFYTVAVTNKTLKPGTSNIPNGLVDYMARLTDLASNTSGNSIERSFIYDTIAPSTIIEYDSVEDHDSAVVSKYFSRPEYHIKFTGENVALGDVTIYQLHTNKDGTYLPEFSSGFIVLDHVTDAHILEQGGNISKNLTTLNGGSVQYTIIPPTTLVSGLEIPDGNLTYKFSLRDDATNVSGNSTDYTFVVVNDSIAPEIPIINTLEISTTLGNTVGYNHPKWTGIIDLVGESAATLGVLHELNNGGWVSEPTPSYVAIEGVDGNSVFNYSIGTTLPNGIHAYKFNLTDDAKNTSGNSAVYQFTMHNTIPTMLNNFSHDSALITTPIQSGNVGLPKSITFDIEKSMATANVTNVYVYNNGVEVGNLQPTTDVNAVTHGNLDASGTIVGSHILQTSDQAGDITIYVTVKSGTPGKFKFWSDSALSAPLADALDFRSGITYTFDQSDSTNAGHPLAFSDIDGVGFLSTSSFISKTGTPGENALIYYKFKSDLSPVYSYCEIHGHDMGYMHTVIITELAAQYTFNTPRYLSTGGNVDGNVYRYTFKVRDELYNESGNSSPDYKFQIDNTAPIKPTVQLYETYVNGALITPNMDSDLGNVNYVPTFMIRGTTDLVENPITVYRAGIDEVFTEISGNLLCPENSDPLYCFTPYINSGIIEGINHYKFQLTDMAGNRSEMSDVLSFTYDKTAPNVPTITTAIIVNPIKNVNIPHIELTGSYAMRLGIYTRYTPHAASSTITNYVEVRDSGNVTIVEAGGIYKYKYLVPIPENDGNVVYKFFLEDDANNISGNTEPYQLIIDNEAPVITEITNSSIEKYKSYVEAGITHTDNVSHLYQPQDYTVTKQYYYNGDSGNTVVVPYTIEDGNVQRNVKIVKDGNVTLVYNVTDKAGNKSLDAYRYMDITQPPSATQQISIKNREWVPFSPYVTGLNQANITVGNVIAGAIQEGLPGIMHIYGVNELPSGGVKPVYHHTYMDGIDPKHVGELTELSNKFGYHIYFDNVGDTDGNLLGNVILTGEQPRFAQIPIYKDMWQLVGFPGDEENANLTTSTFTSMYKAGNNYGSESTTMMSKGNAYWVYNDVDVMLTIDNTAPSNKVTIIPGEHSPTISEDRGNVMARIPYDSSAPPNVGYQVPIITQVNIDEQSGNVNDSFTLSYNTDLIFNSSGLVKIASNNYQYPSWARGNVIAMGLAYTRGGNITTGSVYKKDTSEILEVTEFTIDGIIAKNQELILNHGEFLKTTNKESSIDTKLSVDVVTSIDKETVLRSGKWTPVVFNIINLPVKKFTNTVQIYGLNPDITEYESDMYYLFMNNPSIKSMYNMTTKKLFTLNDSTISQQVPMTNLNGVFDRAVLEFLIDFNSPYQVLSNIMSAPKISVTGKAINLATQTITLKAGKWTPVVFHARNLPVKKFTNTVQIYGLNPDITEYESDMYYLFVNNPSIKSIYNMTTRKLFTLNDSTISQQVPMTNLNGVLNRAALEFLIDFESPYQILHTVGTSTTITLSGI